MSRESQAFALALLRLEGVGRVTAGRLLHRFPSLAVVRETPREQVLHRIRGAPRAEALVGRLFDGEMDARLAEAEAALDRLAERRIRILTEHDPDWPRGLDALAPADRPTVLYAFGDTAVLTRPSVALLARPPLDSEGFETSQTLTRRLLDAGLVPASGVQSGFDTVVCKLAVAAAAPAILVASAGLSRVPPPMRPAAAAAVRAGGVLVSPFPPEHGPFPHDDGERARLTVALARAAAFFGPHEGTPEAEALRWALEHDRPTFGTSAGGGPPLPDRVHPLARDRDLDWVIGAARA
jgi:DNA processing protein